jgi:hypothetical protein
VSSIPHVALPRNGGGFLERTSSQVAPPRPPVTRELGDLEQIYEKMEEEDEIQELSSGVDSLFDSSVTRPPGFEQETVKIHHEAARDESLPETVFFILNAKMSPRAKMRMIAGAAAFLSKNHVYSYLTDPLDMMRAQDDFTMFSMVSRVGLTSFDRNVDFMTAGAIVEAQHSIRLRRSRDALNLRSLNTITERHENVEASPQRKEEKSMMSRIPILGSILGGGG